MTDIVVDVGNSRSKCGIIEPGGSMTLHILGDDWADELPPGKLRWLIAGVHPERIDRLSAWASARGDEARVIRHFTELPITLNVDSPERVGHDRLLGCIAANQLRQPSQAAMTIDIGTATTINLVSPTGVFEGGAILPGVQLMRLALHQNTAQLPLVTLNETPRFPGKNTQDAIHTGTLFAIAGAIRLAIAEVQNPLILVTGGGAKMITPQLAGIAFQHRPMLNLEGLRLCLETQS
jgi:type III pantothenate kinase